MRLPRRLSLFLLGLTFVVTFTRCAWASDPDGYKLITPHFELSTDLDPKTAVEAVKVVKNEPSPAEESGTLANRAGQRSRNHTDGVFTSATIGLGYGQGTYKSTVLTTTKNAFDGFGIDIAGAVGYGLAPGWFVLALEVGVFSHPAFSEQVTFTNGAFVTDLTTVRIGPLADLHVWHDSPLHFQAGFDFIRGTWSGSPGPPRAVEPKVILLPIDEIALGFFAHASAGWVWRVNSYEMSVSLRYHLGRLSSEHASGDVQGLTGLLGICL